MIEKLLNWWRSLFRRESITERVRRIIVYDDCVGHCLMLSHGDFKRLTEEMDSRGMFIIKEDDGSIQFDGCKVAPYDSLGDGKHFWID